MKIVFYSTNSNFFDFETFHINTYPSVLSIFKRFIDEHKADEIYCVTQRPCFFLPEGDIKDNIKILDEKCTIEDVANEIISINPTFAISMTYWVDPFDWLTINDSLVGEKLKDKGIQTICQNVESGMICFDKTKTHQKLKELNFNIPRAVFVDHDMYFCAGSNKKVIHNVYKDYIAHSIKKLSLPLIIKDTVGVSSYGTTVVHTYGEAIGYLNSKRNNSNRIVEEYISGEQFGTEIYGQKGNYTVMPPLTFSLNQYGITSPKLSVKYGPIIDNEKIIKDLREKLIKLSKELDFSGITQVDLIYANDKWYIIEINPRLSGMTYTYSYLLGKSIYDIVYDSCILNKEIKVDENKKVLNIKLPVLPLSDCEKISKIEGVSFVHLTNDENARQEREKGYCEVIITGNSLFDIKNSLKLVMENLPKEDFSNIKSFVSKF